MIDVSTGLCIYCGSERPLEAERCPSCERMWQDRPVTPVHIDLADEAGSVDADETPRLSASLPAADATATDDAPRRDVEVAGIGAGRRWRFVVVAILGMAVIGVAVWVTLPRSEVGGDTAAPTVPTTRAPSTTSSAAPTTTSADTTSAPTTVPLTTVSTIAPITPIGEPIPLDELTLGAFGMGPLDFGAPGDEAIGRLAATLGQPSVVAEAGDADGLCQGEPGTRYTWSGLSVIVSGVDPGQLAGYSLQSSESDQLDLQTLSGIGIGDPWDLLVSTYRKVSLVELDGEPGYVVSRSSDGRTLLWGTLDDAGETAIITSVHSPRPCDSGPTP